MSRTKIGQRKGRASKAKSTATQGIYAGSSTIGYCAIKPVVEHLEQRRLLSGTPNIGVNIRRLGYDSGDELFADAMKEPNSWSNNLADPSNISSRAPIDANGCPTTDAGVEIIKNSSDDGGTYALSFTGQATVSPIASEPNVQIVNLAYDPSSNLTTAQVIVPNGSQELMLDFTNTRRLATDSAATGVTNVQLMRPNGVDSATSYSASTFFSTPILNLLSNFSTIRYMDYTLTNFNPQVNWSDRTLPSQVQTNGKGGSWEYAVALANQTGKDMWINIPEMATDSYITSLAQLIAYGSDGVNSYTGPQGSAISAANPNPVPAGGPVWAGLNANQHVYVEYSNEVWNNSFTQNAQNTAAAIAEVNAGGSPLNYDGSTSTAVWAARRTAKRTVDSSNIFRSVFGDSQMGTQIRPVYQWQYSNLNNTAAFGLQFINNYYNNGDGLTHVASPHPTNYYLWGGGGGWYGGVTNPAGTGDVTIANPAFSSPGVNGTRVDPAGASWTFTGAAGIAANNSALGNPASTSGNQAAYLQSGGTFSEKVNFTGGLADLTFSAASTGSQSFIVTIDGVNYSSAWALTAAYGTQRTGVFNTGVSAGQHTVSFTATGGTGTVFISNVVAETANGMYAKGIQDITSTSRSESFWATAFGLHVVSYEGGFNFGSGDVGTPLQIAANQDARAQQASINQMNEFYAAGGELAMYYDTTNHIWALTLDINNQNTPKINAVQSVLSSPQAALNVGVTLPTVAGKTVTIANTLAAGAGAPGLYAFYAPSAGTYSVTLAGKQSGSVYEQFILDGNTLPGTAVLPSATGNSSPGITFTVSTPGLHALLLVIRGGGTVTPNNPAGSITITAGSVAPPPSGSISGRVFNDANNDGIQDNGDTGIANVRVYQDPNYSHQWESATEAGVLTDASGNYTFTNLPADPEILRIILPDGSQQTSPASGAGIFVGQNTGKTLTGENFGIYTPPPPGGTITGTVFNDANANGIPDTGETGVSGTTVYADLNNTGSFAAGDPSAVTDANGNYTLAGLSGGSYTLRETVPAGDTETSPGNNAGLSVNVVAGQTVTSQNFGLTVPPPPPPALITGAVFNDANGNGILDNGEVGIANVTVYIDANNVGSYAAGDQYANTDGNGNFVLGGLAAGTYNIREIVPTGDTQTSPASNGANTLTVSAGQTVVGENFGVSVPVGPPAGSISGTVFNDANDNGVQDAGETGVANVRVYQDPNYSHAWDSTTEQSAVTDASGNYIFASPPADPEILRVILPSGMQQSLPTGNAGIFVGQNTGQTLTNKNFGIYTPVVGVGNITGTVFNDLNGDHAQTTGEPNLAGVVVFIDSNGDGILNNGEVSAATNSSGTFTFTGIAAGSYTICISPANGYRQTLPITGGTKVSVTTNNTVSAGQFAVTSTAYVGGTLFNDLNGNGVQNSGETGLSGWKVYIDSNKDGIFQSTEPTAVTSSVGFWYFRSVVPGTYVIRTVSPAGWTTTHAYTVTLASGANITNGSIGAKKS